MKKNILNLVTIFLFANFYNAQNLVNAFTKEGKIFVQTDNGNTKEIVSTGENSVIAFSRIKYFVIYKRLEQKSKTKEMGSNDQLSIHLFNLTSNEDILLFTTCFDGNGGTIPDYGNSSIYPNKYLCGFEFALLSNDGERLFFQTN